MSQKWCFCCGNHSSKIQPQPPLHAELPKCEGIPDKVGSGVIKKKGPQSLPSTPDRCGDMRTSKMAKLGLFFLHSKRDFTYRVGCNLRRSTRLTPQVIVLFCEPPHLFSESPPQPKIFFLEKTIFFQKNFGQNREKKLVLCLLVQIPPLPCSNRPLPIFACRGARPNFLFRALPCDQSALAKTSLGSL